MISTFQYTLHKYWQWVNDKACFLFHLPIQPYYMMMTLWTRSATSMKYWKFSPFDSQNSKQLNLNFLHCNHSAPVFWIQPKFIWLNARQNARFPPKWIGSWCFNGAQCPTVLMLYKNPLYCFDDKTWTTNYLWLLEREKRIVIDRVFRWIALTHVQVAVAVSFANTITVRLVPIGKIFKLFLTFFPFLSQRPSQTNIKNINKQIVGHGRSSKDLYVSSCNNYF